MIQKHRSQRGRYNSLHCSMEVVYYIFTSTPGVIRIHFRTNPRTQVFLRKSIFLKFCGVPKNFLLTPKTLFCLRNPNFGGPYFKNFLIRAMFQELEISKTAIIGQNQSRITLKPQLGLKSFRSTHDQISTRHTCVACFSTEQNLDENNK